MIEINVDDLPQYSNWPHRMLGLVEWEKKVKNSSEVLREFDRDKWGTLLDYIRSSQSSLSLKQVEKFVYGNPADIACLLNSKLVKLSSYAAFEEQYKIILEALSDQVQAKALCELGAGYGQIVLRLAKENSFSKLKIIAAEYTSSGVQLIEYLARSEKMNVVAGFCDLNKPGITDISIPHQGILFTSYSACYLTDCNLKFVEDISSFQPSVVYHFEPIYEHCNPRSLLGLMQQKYIEQNSYNRNLLTVLKDAETKGLIKIITEKPQVFGSNPFLPMSIIAWAPVGDSAERKASK
jgi:hypothetical protein